jgi:hypothetical protein
LPKQLSDWKRTEQELLQTAPLAEVSTDAVSRGGGGWENVFKLNLILGAMSLVGFATAMAGARWWHKGTSAKGAELRAEPSFEMTSLVDVEQPLVAQEFFPTARPSVAAAAFVGVAAKKKESIVARRALDQSSRYADLALVEEDLIKN